MKDMDKRCPECLYYWKDCCGTLARQQESEDVTLLGLDELLADEREYGIKLGIISGRKLAEREGVVVEVLCHGAMRHSVLPDIFVYQFVSDRPILGIDEVGSHAQVRLIRIDENNE